MKKLSKSLELIVRAPSKVTNLVGYALLCGWLALNPVACHRDQQNHSEIHNRGCPHDINNLSNPNILIDDQTLLVYVQGSWGMNSEMNLYTRKFGLDGFDWKCQKTLDSKDFKDPKYLPYLDKFLGCIVQPEIGELIKE